MLASVHEHTELILDTGLVLAHQANGDLYAGVVTDHGEFPGVTDNALGGVQHLLQPICYDLQHPSINCTAVVSPNGTTQKRVAADSESSDRWM